jgi:hypothetical protein
MPESMGFLVLVISAFVAFGATLIYADIVTPKR